MAYALQENYNVITNFQTVGYISGRFASSRYAFLSALRRPGLCFLRFLSSHPQPSLPPSPLLLY